MQGFLDLGRRPALEQFPQASMPKALEHEISIVTHEVTN
jgi:hypothetical protein